MGVMRTGAREHMGVLAVQVKFRSVFAELRRKGIAVEPPAMPLGLKITCAASPELEPSGRTRIAGAIVHYPPI